MTPITATDGPFLHISSRAYRLSLIPIRRLAEERAMTIVN